MPSSVEQDERCDMYRLQRTAANASFEWL